MCKKYAKILMKIVTKQPILHFANFATISQNINLVVKAECTNFASIKVLYFPVVYNIFFIYLSTYFYFL